MKRNCLIAQSGGPTATINATLCGAYTEMAKSPDVGAVYGGINGIQGILEGRILDLGPILSNEDNLKALSQTPSSSLGSCRFKLSSPAEKPEEYKRIFDVFKKNDIGYFIYIGGNDSMDTVQRLNDYAGAMGYDILCAGAPKTVDNDLVITDHTPGYGSCAKYLSTVVMESAQDNRVYDMESVFVIEVMGRDTGWIALSAALARDSDNTPQCDLIYTPETIFYVDRYLADVEVARKAKKRVVIVVSEGIRNQSGVYISDTGEVDAFGHTRLRGAGAVVADLIVKNFGVKVRAAELSILQRCAAHVVSATDVSESEEIGRHAAKGVLGGLTGKMSYMRRLSESPYKIEYDYADVAKIANAVKRVPDEYINATRNHITEKGFNYAYPLISGERQMIMKNNVPVFLNLAAVYAGRK